MKTKSEKKIAKDIAAEVATEVKEITIVLESPKEEIKAKNIEELFDYIKARFDILESKMAVKIKEGNGRGPLSTRGMTDDDATKIMTGDMKDKSIKDCAKELGLSYGQIYSARNGYTFKTQYKARVDSLLKK